MAFGVVPWCFYLPHRCSRPGAPLALGFWCRAMVLRFASPLLAAWLWTSWYIATLPKQAKYRAVTWLDYAPPWFAMGLGTLSLSFGSVTYGVHPTGQAGSDSSVRRV